MVSATPIRVIMSSSARSGHPTIADAAADLAGDVSAAAEAYENLKRLLQRQFADPPRANLERGPNLEAVPTLTALPSRASQMNLALALRHPPMAPQLPGGSVLAAGQAPRWPDIRGFLAGVAVSAAIGAALYICLAAG
jgi:hypothetical protein